MQHRPASQFVNLPRIDLSNIQSCHLHKTSFLSFRLGKAGVAALVALTIGSCPTFAQDGPGATLEASPADDVTPVDDALSPQPVTALLVAEVLAPELDEMGQPRLDAAGQPVRAFQTIDDTSSLLPGDEFRYLVTVTSSGPEVEALALNLDLPAAGRLLPQTVTSSANSSFEVGSSVDAGLREPLFVDESGVEVLNPDWVAAPDRFDQLFVTFDRIAPGASATVTYHLVVR